MREVAASGAATNGDGNVNSGRGVLGVKPNNGVGQGGHHQKLNNSAPHGQQQQQQQGRGNSNTPPPTYALGKDITRDIVSNVSLPLPLPFCRAMFLNSSSPVNAAWEAGRGDRDYQRSEWTFPPGFPREFEGRHGVSEQELISSAPMTGAHRTIQYGRYRNRELVRLLETVVVEADDNETMLALTISERMPRRGFSVKVRLVLRSFGGKSKSCEARILADLCPVGKNLTDQLAVHKAFVLVVDEISTRYGAEGKGLLAVFLDMRDDFPKFNKPVSAPIRSIPLRRSQQEARDNLNTRTKILPGKESTKTSLTSFKDVIPQGQGSQLDTLTAPRPLPGNNSASSAVNKGGSTSSFNPSQTSPARRANSNNRRNFHDQARPSTPSIHVIDNTQPQRASIVPQQRTVLPQVDDFTNVSKYGAVVAPSSATTVEVKPLPKIRLDLCPVPREEDEEADDSSISVADKKGRRSKHSKHRHRKASRKSSSRGKTR